MPQGKNPTGTIHVRVVLDVEVDPDAWARDMMHAPDTLVTEVRRDVKRWTRDVVSGLPADEHAPIGEVTAQGIYG